MNPGDLIQLRLIWRHTLGQNAINVRNYKVTAVASPSPTLLEIAEDIVGELIPLYKNCVSANWTYQGCKFRQIFPTVGVAQQTLSLAGVGALIGDSLPLQVTGMISLRASTARTRCRGRIYLPCPSEAESGSGQPLLPLRNAYATFGQTLLNVVQTPGAGGGSSTTVPVLISNQVGLPQAVFQVDRFIVRNNFGTQRRRSTINKPDVNEFP